MILIPHKCLESFELLPSSLEPITDDDNDYIEDIESDKTYCFEFFEFAIPYNDEKDYDGASKEADVAKEWTSLDFERFDDAHGAHDARGDESGSSK